MGKDRDRQEGVTYEESKGGVKRKTKVGDLGGTHVPSEVFPWFSEVIVHCSLVGVGVWFESR